MNTKKQPWRGVASYRDYLNRAIHAATPAWRPCLREFATWLEEMRHCELSTIVHRVGSTRAFLQARGGRGGVRTLGTLSAWDVEDIFINYARAHGHGARQNMRAAMRSFLRFAASQNWVQPELVGAVPSLRRYRLSGVPRGVAEDALRALITNPQCSARNHALILLFAMYGIRRSQVCTLRLTDIDWRNRTIYFSAHKGGKAVVHYLAPAIASVLAKYLKHERPIVLEEAVFIRAQKPYLPLGPEAISDVIRKALRRAGVESTPCGPHAMRHAFATRLLQRGQPLKVIADLLGHRSLESVSIYAKVDHPQLFEVAAEWPEVMS